MKEVHVLNGDALREQFPTGLPGEVLVARECLIEGELLADDLAQFFAGRAAYLGQVYGSSQEEYREKVQSQFEALSQLPSGSVINLWFEEDLFCQVNFWFVVYLLEFDVSKAHHVYLILPHGDLQYGFGGLNQEELKQVYAKRQLLNPGQRNSLARLWLRYQKEDIAGMLQIARFLEKELPFVYPAVQAHAERFPEEAGLGKPETILKEIVDELDNPDFGTAFRLFNKRAAIYGFGDLQVKRMWDTLLPY